MTFDPSDETTWTREGMQNFLQQTLADRLRPFVGERITPTVLQQLEKALNGFADDITMPPRYEIVDCNPQPDGSVRYTIRDNRPGPDSLLLRLP